MNAVVISRPAEHAPAQRAGWTLRTRLSVAAAACAVLSLVTTCFVIGVRGSAMAEADAAALARGAAERVAQKVEAELSLTYSVIESLAQTQAALRADTSQLTRVNLDVTMKAVLESQPGWLGTYSTWEPNALDGRDAEYANKGPGYDATGRYIAYWHRGPGHIVVEPGGDTETAGINDWYDIPRRTGKNALIEPYVYKIAGKDELLTSLVTPIVVQGRFMGVVGADYLLRGLAQRLSAMESVPEGQIALLSNGGLYVSNVDAQRIGAAADDLPELAKNAVRSGERYEFVDASGWVHVLVPVRPTADVPAWSLRVSYPMSAARASARELLKATIGTAAICVIVTVLVLVALISRMLIPLSQLTSAVESLASGQSNLRVELPVRGDDELARISGAFNRFIAKLRAAFSDVRDASEQVEMAVEDIATGNADLSTRTESQSSSLHSVASSMTRLTATVTDNARTASEAVSLTSAATRTAQHSEQVMKEAVASMDGLSAASRRIAEITAVIDSIAFQTNILALNAAVEAARAGAQGKGFAVVATEVRDLAQRSAAAAKDIKQLIDDSVERVDEGSRLIHASGAAVSELVAAVNRVTSLIDTIGASSDAQATGISQVDSAIEAIEEMTQQNAGLVQEAAAAASSLRQQAHRLTATVASFT